MKALNGYSSARQEKQGGGGGGIIDIFPWAKHTDTLAASLSHLDRRQVVKECRGGNGDGRAEGESE